MKNKGSRFNRWMKKHGYWKQYVGNLKGDECSIPHPEHKVVSKNKRKVMMRFIILDSFVWCETEEGRHFWDGVHYKWDQYCFKHGIR